MRPPAEALSFRPLAPALRDPKRNFLYDHLGLGEDDPKNKEVLRAEPDCADLPYFLRSYFAWKLGLPTGFRDCNRGSSTSAPRCTNLFTNEEPIEGKTVLAVMRTCLRKLANTVHSGSARTALDDEATDLYPSPGRPRRPCVRAPSTPIRTATCWCWSNGCPRPRALAACCSRSMVSPTAAWGASASGRGRSCLPPGKRARARAGRPFVRWSVRARAGTRRSRRQTGRQAGRQGLAAPIRRRTRRPATGPDNQTLARAPGGKVGFAPFSREQATLPVESFYARMSKLINPARAAAQGRLRGDAGRAGRAAGDPRGLGRQRRGLRQAEQERGDRDARRAQDLRDRGALGGLRHPVARHAPDHRDEGADRDGRADRKTPRAVRAWAARRRPPPARRSRRCTSG